MSRGWTREMSRYMEVTYNPMKMIPVSFEQQILPGSFEYSLSYLMDHELDLSAFDGHCNIWGQSKNSAEWKWAL